MVDPGPLSVVSYVKENSKAGRLLWDNPSLGMHRRTGKNQLLPNRDEEAARLGGADEVIYFDEKEVVPMDVPGAKVFKHATVFKPFLDADVVINLPKMKVHLAGTVTLGIKNWNGIIPNCHPSGQQQGCHRIDLGQKMADCLKIRQADLTIVDAVIGMEGQGPHAGTPIEMDLIVAGRSTPSVDAVACSIMGFDPMEIPAVRCAGTDGLGEINLDNIEVLGEPVASVMKHFKRPKWRSIGVQWTTCCMQQTLMVCYVMFGGPGSFAISASIWISF